MEESQETPLQGSADRRRKKALSTADVNVQSRPPSTVLEGKSKKLDNRSNMKKTSSNTTSSSQRQPRSDGPSQSSTRHISEGPAETESSVQYRRLAPITRRVSRHKIEAQWEPLQDDCIDRITQFLQDVERPVIMRVRDEEKRMQARTALQMVSRKLINKLSKGLPFPPGVRSQRAEDFDFERVLDNNKILESQLTPILHSNELLATELSNENELLESEREKLAELERNAKLAASKRKESQKKLHLLLQSEDDSSAKHDNSDHGLNLVNTPNPLNHDVSLFLFILLWSNANLSLVGRG